MIQIRKCLEIMHSGATFSLKVVAYDRRRRNKSGAVGQYDAALVWGDGGRDRTKIKGERQMTDLEKILSGHTPIDKRDPNHSIWYTRNIRIYQNGRPTEMIVKIHPPLIIEFNGEITCP